MKKRIGELNGKPIVIGGENEVTKNEIHYSVVDGIVVLKVRKDDGKLHPVTAAEDDIATASLMEDEGQIIPDEPVEGIKEVIAKLKELNYEVVVVSTRCATPKGIRAIYAYLNKYGIEVDKVLKEKPPAAVYIDDRAICFNGDCNGLVDKIVNFKNWLGK